jgi:hypothetical protein
MRELEEIDTIPKPDGLGKRGAAGHCLFDKRSELVRCVFDYCSGSVISDSATTKYGS